MDSPSRQDISMPDPDRLLAIAIFSILVGVCAVILFAVLAAQWDAKHCTPSLGTHQESIVSGRMIITRNIPNKTCQP